MKIAIQAADLDAKRIDGTRVYISNLLKNFGKIDQESRFLIFHRKKFNPELTPPDFSNYEIIKKNAPFLWTQTRFSWELFKQKPDVFWMPMQALPIFYPRKTKSVITSHDLAFRYFPEFFPKKDLRRLLFFSDLAIKKSNKIIAVSNSTKQDILKFYPQIPEEKIRVIYHGFDAELFQKNISQEKLENFLKSYNLRKNKYLLYVGAIQPRKNLTLLVDTFSKIKKDYPEIKLVFVGEKAWLWKELMEKIEKSHYKEDIKIIGQVSFDKLPLFYRGASIFIFPSFYEGFGMPILESFASKTPAILSNNSSLPEIGGKGALYFENNDRNDLKDKIEKILENESLKENIIKEGEFQLKKFSWEKCAQETLNFLKEN